jgi:hypothetical protein
MVLAVALVAASLAVPAAGAEPRLDPDLTVTPDLIKAPNDFSSTFRGYWWDFADPDHYAERPSREGWADQRLANGWFVGVTEPHETKPTTTGASIRLTALHIDGYTRNGQFVRDEINWEASEHQFTPLDPGYRFVTVRMCASQATKGQVRWFRNASLDDGDFGGTSYHDIRRGCQTYRFDLQTDRHPDVGTLAWDAGGMYALDFKPATDPGVTVMVDYITLSNRAKGDPITIGWDPRRDPVGLFFSSDPAGTRLTRIAGRRTGGTHVWRTPNLAPGTYYIFGVVGRTTYAGPAFNVDPPPQGEILDPSYTSGPDYATEVVGNPWDMNDAADIAGTRGLESLRFVNGIAVARSTDDGNAFFMQVTDAVDPHRYRYITYRMWIESLGWTLGSGAGSRAAWYNNPLRPRGSWSTTAIVRAYDGWRTVTIDLQNAHLDRDDIGVWGDFDATDVKIDPHESSIPRIIKLDYVYLTGDTRADRAHRIRYLTADEGALPPRVRLFYDTDRDPAGATPIRCADDPRPPEGPAESCRWRTAALPAGDYFVHMLLTDAAGNRTWVKSQTPLLVRHT